MAKSAITYSVKGWKWVLHKLYGFDRWHITSLNERPYALGIIDYCNQRVNRDSCIEIGCGLGDIIRDLRYRNKYGLDADKKVLKAAAFINRIKGGTLISYAFFEFPKSVLQGKYDVIIMVNWIHHIPPVILKDKIKEYMADNLNKGGELIFDTVQDPAYEVNHNIKDFENEKLYTITRVGVYERQREVWSIKNLEN